MTVQGNSSAQRARTRLRRGGRVFAATLVALSVALVGCTAHSGPKTVTAPTLPDGNLPAELVASMQGAVETAIAASGSSGAIVGIWVPWGGSWVAGVGTTTVGGKIPMDPDMSFRVGSITRVMTCDALYGMADDGLVKLDDSMSKYVSGVAPWGDITLKDLCDSDSGLASLPASVRGRQLDSLEREWDARELASFGLGADPLAAPGDRYIDSDVGYLLLGLALERASGLTSQQLIAKYTATPLGLDHTLLPKDAAAVPPKPSAHAYLTQQGEDGQWACGEPRDVTKISATTGATDSGVVSTVRDLGIYAMATAQQTLDGKDSKRYDSPLQMDPNSPTWLQSTGGVQFAGTLMGRDGSTIGQSTAMYSDPKTGVTIVVTLNNSTVSVMARALAWQLAAMAGTAPAKAGKTVEEYAVPWTAEEYGQAVRDLAICPIP